MLPRPIQAQDYRIGKLPHAHFLHRLWRDGPELPWYLSRMSERWGFDLDITAIRLMRREGGLWREVAVEKIDGPDIEDRLMAMVAQIEPPAPVELFLPREQILYTDVRVTDEDSASDEIDAAMDGRTPYSLHELEIDWHLVAPDMARVAAIARETLDEAAEFAEMRGLQVSGFSSLADPEDFPRMPDFGGGANIFEDDPVEGGEDDDIPVSFTSRREPIVRQTGGTPGQPQPPHDNKPVVQVDDPTPVMNVKASDLPPLNPGKPLAAEPSAPRIRTDIAASTMSGRVAASLSPTMPAIKLRQPTGNGKRTLIVFAIAALLTIGIAAIVWAILPLGPEEASLAAPAPPVAEPAEVAEADPGVQPSAPFTDLAVLDAPSVEPPPPAMGVAIAARPTLQAPAALPRAEAGNFTPPAATGPAPFPPRPEKLANLQTSAPVPGLDGGDDAAETTDDIYIASIERRDLAFDAIALPSAGALTQDRTPVVVSPPAFTESSPTQEIQASIDPATVPEIAPDASATALPTPESDPEIAVTEPDEPIAPEPPQTAATLIPTALAAALPDLKPRARPGDFVVEIERQQFGGLTRSQLSEIRPPRRPASEQVVAAAQQPETSAPSSELAVATSLQPRTRPQDFDAIVATAVVQSRVVETTVEPDLRIPDTSAAIEAALAGDSEPEPRPQDTPRLAIPSSASVSRQATIEDAIRLNKINLVGVYGVPSDRRALIRLPSGRYVKVKVGDRVDGGTVASISDSALTYKKGSRVIALEMPKG
jgi:type IV pilus biogenesis protein PilP